MDYKKLASLMFLLIASGLLVSCSNTPNYEIKNDKPIKYQVKSNSKKTIVSESLADSWLSKGVVTPKKTQTVPISSPSHKTVQLTNRVIPKSVTHVNRSARIINRPPKSANRLIHKVKPVLRATIHKQTQTNLRQNHLAGDYSSNKQTNSFINMMVVKHGFNREHLNYIFTNTKATPFLKRMAYADAYGRKKSKNKKTRNGRWNRYRGNFLTERTISKGIQFYRANRIALQRAERMYGVPQEYILGIIGVETRYGGNVGKNRAIDALSAMGFNNPRRGKYFRSELESYLLMTRKERLDPLKPMASYAGALGLSQFMPSNIKRYAVDHDRSGSVNLWTPSDAIGSVANYFKKHGWKTGGTVAVRANSSNRKYRTLKTGFKSKHSLTRLKSSGVTANYLGNISGKASLIKLNTYSGDELWLGGHNFYVITRYNHSTHYGMAVHQLANAIKARIGGRSNVIRQASNNGKLNEVMLALSN